MYKYFVLTCNRAYDISLVVVILIVLYFFVYLFYITVKLPPACIKLLRLFEDSLTFLFLLLQMVKIYDNKFQNMIIIVRLVSPIPFRNS